MCSDWQSNWWPFAAGWHPTNGASPVRARPYFERVTQSESRASRMCNSPLPSGAGACYVKHFVVKGFFFVRGHSVMCIWKSDINSAFTSLVIYMLFSSRVRRLIYSLWPSGVLEPEVHLLDEIASYKGSIPCFIVITWLPDSPTWEWMYVFKKAPCENWVCWMRILLSHPLLHSPGGLTLERNQEWDAKTGPSHTGLEPGVLLVATVLWFPLQNLC